MYLGGTKICGTKRRWYENTGNQNNDWLLLGLINLGQKFLHGGHWDFHCYRFAQFLVQFSGFALKNSGFSVLVSCAVCRFNFNLVFGFQFLSTMIVVFQFFCPKLFTVFLILWGKLHPAVMLNSNLNGSGPLTYVTGQN